MPKLVVMTGLPASGKSTLGAVLASALGWPLLDKDDFLESGFARHIEVDAEKRTRLSRHADLDFEASVRRCPAAVAASWWRHPRSPVASGTPTWWLRHDAGEVVEVHCQCPPEEAARRFLARRRHPGHQDQRWTAEALSRHFAEQAGLGPLTAGQAIVVNTFGAPDPVLVAALTRRVTATLEVTIG
jgi:glucokinase